MNGWLRVIAQAQKWRERACAYVDHQAIELRLQILQVERKCKDPEVMGVLRSKDAVGTERTETFG